MISFGIDIGGTGCKCVAFREDGNQLALAYKEYPLQAGATGLPASMLSDAVFEVISACTKQLDNPQEVVAITVSSFGESFVAVDANGEALTDILMYFGSTEGEKFDQLVSDIGEEAFMRIALLKPETSYSLSKMLYTKQVSDRPVWKYLFVAGYIAYCLTGEAYSDISLACRSLLYDVKNRCWSKELLDACGIEEATLPRVLPTGGIVGPLLPAVAAKLQLPENVQVVMGSHDQIVNALGAGVTEIGEAVDTSGTCECVTPLFADIPNDFAFQKNNFGCVPYLADRGYVTYAYNISAGSVVRWCRDVLARYLDDKAKQDGKSVYDLLNEECPDKPTSLMILPFLQGMGGTPDVDANATGLIAGLTTETRVPDIYRAILEGITFEMRYNQEKLAENGVELGRLYACGGGARSEVWLQIKADILGCEILPVKIEETGAMGSAILGLAAVTSRDPFEIASVFWQYGEPIQPDSERRDYYSQRYELYKTLRNLYMQHKHN